MWQKKRENDQTQKGLIMFSLWLSPLETIPILTSSSIFIRVTFFYKTN